jgi:hypothetical protein
MADFEILANDYLGSPQFMLAASNVKAQAAEFLAAFAAGCRQRGGTVLQKRSPCA